MALFDPATLFSGTDAENLGAPLLFGVIVGTVGALFAGVWNVAFGGMISLLGRAPIEDLAFSTGAMLFVLILSPLFVLVGLFVTAAIYHVMLLLVGGARRGFGTTFRAVAYGSTPQLLCIVPICGSFVGGLWSLVLVILGAYYGHRTSAWRAILAYFLPMIVCCCVGFYVLSMLGFLGAVAD